MKNDYIGEMSEAMTNEKALQGFEEYCETCRKNCEEAGAELVCACCKVKRAKEAIEKQIPKKVVRKHKKHARWYNDDYFCPSCGETAETENADPFERYALNWCDHCGQKLDWSE